MNLNKHSKVRAVGLSSSFALLALLGLAVFCPSTDGANAATDLNKSGTFNLDFVLNKYDTKTFTIDFFLSSALSIKLENANPNVSSSVNPTPTGQTISGYTDFSVTSNSTSGYNVYVYNNTGDTSLKSTDTNNNDRITSTSTAVNTLSSLNNNTWGYNLSKFVDESSYAPEALTFNPIATKGDPVQSTSDNSVSEQTYRLTYGAKVDYGIQPDTYGNTMNVQVVARPELTTAANSESYSLREDAQQSMQDKAQANQSETNEVNEESAE